MNILVIGAGGREHSFVWKLVQSPLAKAVFVAPGNAGTAQLATNLDIDPLQFDVLREALLQHQIDLVVVGPEDPLVRGIHDFIAADASLQQVRVLGPRQAAAQLEGSKDFAKQFMMRHHIPTARYGSFRADTIDQAFAFLDTLSAPYVLKADGLAAGKGVLILDSLDQAKHELRAMFEGKFGQASQTVVIEEFLRGIELSVFVLTDGHSYKILPEAKDYKRIGEGDTGPNTGGMGAVSPVPFADAAFLQKVEQRIVQPTIEGLQRDNLPYVGFLFIGLMNVDGEPFVIEYNVRMGDPETEVVVPRIETDLVALFDAATRERLHEVPLRIRPQVATTVVLVSEGYPNAYPKGRVITGIDACAEALVFHAGTRIENNRVLTNGGRVLALTGMADTQAQALERSFAAARTIAFEGMYYRRDIGADLAASASS